MSTVYVFLRHAESVANVGGWLSGWDDVPLTPRGEEQARAAAQALAAHPVGRVLVSDLGRARHTARLVLGERRPPVHVLGELRERNMGALQGQSIAEARADGRMERWILPWDAAPPGGESHAEVVRRAFAALRHWHDGTPTLVVAHGSLIRDVVAVLDGLERETIGRLPSAPHATPLVRTVHAFPRG